MSCKATDIKIESHEMSDDIENVQVLDWELSKNNFNVKIESDGHSIMDAQISTLDAECHQIDVNSDIITQLQMSCQINPDSTITQPQMSGQETKPDGTTQSQTKHMIMIRMKPCYVKLNRLYKCHICAKGFSNKRTMTQHINTHIGEKPCYVQSSKSGQETKSDDTIAQPQMSGQATKPNSMTKHMSITSMASCYVKLIRCYACHMCCKVFIQVRDLTGHMSTHTEEKHSKCIVSGGGFHSRCLAT